MKTLSLFLSAIVLSACSQAAKPQMDAATQAAASRISIANGDNVPGHSQYVTLGRVHALCEENPNASYITIVDIARDTDDLQKAAYREYGSQVDAIVDPDVHYGRNKGPWNPYSHADFECEGTAAHFQQQLAGELPAQSR